MTAQYKIYQFGNATLLEKRRHYGSELEVSSNGEVLKEVKLFSEEVQKWFATQSYVLLEASYGELELVSVTTTQEVASYVPHDSSKKLRVLDADSYERLSSNLKMLYKKQMSEPVETRTKLDFEFIPLNEVLLREELLNDSEYFSELHKLVLPLWNRERNRNAWRNTSKPEFSLERNLPVKLASNDLISVLKELLSQRGVRAGGSLATNALVTIPYFYSEEPRIEVKHFVTTYHRETKKVLDRKKNGQPYADGRGRYMPDYPAIAGVSTVTSADLDGWWKAIDGNELSDQKKLEAMRALLNHLAG